MKLVLNTILIFSFYSFNAFPQGLSLQELARKACDRTNAEIDGEIAIKQEAIERHLRGIENSKVTTMYPRFEISYQRFLEVKRVIQLRLDPSILSLIESYKKSLAELQSQRQVYSAPVQAMIRREMVHTYQSPLCQQIARNLEGLYRTFSSGSRVVTTLEEGEWIAVSCDPDHPRGILALDYRFEHKRLAGGEIQIEYWGHLQNDTVYGLPAQFTPAEIDKLLVEMASARAGRAMYPDQPLPNSFFSFSYLQRIIREYEAQILELKNRPSYKNCEVIRR